MRLGGTGHDHHDAGTAAGLTTLAALLALTAKFEWSAPDVLAPERPPIIAEQAPIEPPPLPRIRIRTPAPIEPIAPTETSPLAPVDPPDPTQIAHVPLGPPVITRPRWLEQPNAADFSRHYPERAIRWEKEGRVVLDCVVAANGRICCNVLEEAPAGWGFGDAALRIAGSFRMSPLLADGQATEGGRVSVPISFRLQ
jgi:protein TonB